MTDSDVMTAGPQAMKPQPTGRDPSLPTPNPLPTGGRYLKSATNQLGTLNASDSELHKRARFEADRKMVVDRLSVKVSAAEKKQLTELCDFYEELDAAISNLSQTALRARRQEAAEQLIKNPGRDAFKAFQSLWAVPIEIQLKALTDQQAICLLTRSTLFRDRIAPLLGAILPRLLPGIDELIAELDKKERESAQSYGVEYWPSETLLAVHKTREKIRHEGEMLRTCRGGHSGGNPRATLKDILEF